MSDIINVARIIAYTYTSGGRTITGPTKEATVTNQYGTPSVELTKVCTVKDFPDATAADLNEIITLRYTVTNSSPADITFTTITILDPVLTSSSIQVVGNETGGTHSQNTISVTLPAGGLAKGQNAVYTIDIKVISPSALTTVLSTIASGTFRTATGNLNYDDDACTIGYQHGDVRIEKTNNPSSIVTTDTTIEYTITIYNVGNVPATIAALGFEDDIPTGTTFVAITQGAGVIAENGRGMIVNQQPIVLQPFNTQGSSVTFKYTVKVKAQ